MFYQEKSPVIFEKLRKKYLIYLKDNFFKQLQREFPKLKFNFEKFFTTDN
jgi:hypothetical protein